MRRLQLDRHPEVGSTELSIGAGALEDAGRSVATFPTVLLVTDATVAGTPWPSRVERSCLEAGGPEPLRALLPGGEEAKSLGVAGELCARWLDAGAGRDAVVVAVGGGIVTDTAGFAASIYLRGLPWVAVPTTVLAMADAAIGGKTGVNASEGKNLLGSFWHPLSVHADPIALGTLETREFRAGWAEVLKAGAIADRGLFERLESEALRVLERDEALLAELLAAAVAVKVAIVVADEREAGPREILNFGHTLGHAIETASGHAVCHGEAVAIGMVAEAQLAVQLGRASAGLSERIAAACSALGLPTRMPPALTTESLAAALGVDKKRRAGRLRVAVPTALGEHDATAPCVEVEAGELLAAARS